MTASATHGPPRTFYVLFGKRALDLVIGGTVLIVLSPLLLLIAALIKLEDRGPVFYRQERIGRGGRAFFVTKFRSMCVGAEHKGAGILVQKNDNRITRIGTILRKLSLDELAQVFDVIRGTMSIVGPRPGLRYQYELYDAEQRRRLDVRPGITGWAQVHGRNAIAWPERIRRDLEYVDGLTFGKDLLVLFKTIPAVLTGSDQIADADYWKNKRREVEAARAMQTAHASAAAAGETPEPPTPQPLPDPIPQPDPLPRPDPVPPAPLPDPPQTPPGPGPGPVTPTFGGGAK